MPACASYLLGCKSKGTFAVVDPHVDLADEYVALAAAQGARIDAVIETHVPADHVSGLPELVARTAATAYLPEGSGVEVEHHPLRDGVTVGNVEIAAVSTPGHALAHHAYLVTDRARGDEPWFVLTGDALLVGDAGRPDLHAHGEHTVEQMARSLYRSLTERLPALPDDLVPYPAHYSGSVCGAGCRPTRCRRSGSSAATTPRCSSTPRTRSPTLIIDLPPAPEQQAAIVAANRSGRPLTEIT